jgi:hypothetical protein
MTAAVELHRRRERNAARSVEVLPPDVDTKVAALQPRDSTVQLANVTAMLSHARTGLLAAIAAQDIRGIVDWKAKASAIHEVAKQLQLGKDIQLDVAEFVRRAERGLGIAIREGQARGEIATKSSAARDRRRREHGDNISVLPSVKDLAPDFFDNSHKGASICDFTDGVSDEQFDEAITEARAEGNLSRANVARKSCAKAVPVVDAPVDPAPTKTRKTAAARRVMEHLVVTINSLAFISADTDPAEVDGGAHADDIKEMLAGIKTITNFVRKVAGQ